MKKKLKKYTVKMEREVRFTAEVDVEAESEDVAKDMAMNIADESGGYWVEQDCISHTARVTKRP